MNNDVTTDLIVLEGTRLHLPIFSSPFQRLLLNWIADFLTTHPLICDSGIEVRVEKVEYRTTEWLVELSVQQSEIEAVSKPLHDAVLQKLQTTNVMTFLTELANSWDEAEKKGRG